MGPAGLPGPPPAAQAMPMSSIEAVIEQRRRDLGGFQVGRLLPAHQCRMVGPFVFFDHLGPVELAPDVARPADVRPHPHIGLSTLTYLFEGEIVHRDSLRSEQPIRPGEVNWMTAGRGITHSERFERARAQGDRLNGLQCWVALPKAHEETAPKFAHYGAQALPTFAADGLWARLVAGSAFGADAPVKTLSPLFYVHWRLDAGASARLPAEYPERAAYIAAGAIEIDGRSFGQGRLLLFRAGAAVSIEALTPAVILLLGGEPVGERYLEWNFVSSSKQRIEQAKADWRAGRFELPQSDNAEWIPLPEPPAASDPQPL